RPSPCGPSTLRSMFAPASCLRSQDQCLKPLGHLSVVTSRARFAHHHAGFTRDVPPLALRAIDLAVDVRSGILPPQSRPVPSTTRPSLRSYVTGALRAPPRWF